MRSVPVAVLVVVELFAITGPAHAEESPAERAEQLFTQANQLADQGQFGEACPLYEQSNRLDPGIGTQFNIADCYEHSDRPASALAMFRVVERAAGQLGKLARQSSARERAEALEKMVPRLRIRVAPEDADTPGLVVTCDDRAIDPSDFDRPLPYDPGSHVVSASAPGHLPWQLRVDLGRETKVLSIPVLASAPTLTPLAAPPPAFGVQRKVAVASGGLGVLGVAVGGIFGILSLVEHADFTRECARTLHGSCVKGNTSSANGALSTSEAEGNVAAGAFIVGGLGVAGAVTLWLTAPAKAATPSGIDVAPALGPQAALVRVRAAW
jgi:hypothetical protein